MSDHFFVPSAEAAFIAELSDRDMNRVFDEHLVPDQLVSADRGRRFARLASAFAHFYFTTESVFAAALRRDVVAELTKRVVVLEDKDRILSLRSDLNKSAWMVDVRHGQCVDVSSFVVKATERAKKVDDAEAAVDVSEDVMGGLPVFKGTRVPLEVVTASVDKGIAFDRIKASYEFLTLELVEAANVYQAVHPRRGRKRSVAELNPQWPVIKKRVVRPAPAASTR